MEQRRKLKFRGALVRSTVKAKKLLKIGSIRMDSLTAVSMPDR